MRKQARAREIPRGCKIFITPGHTLHTAPRRFFVFLFRFIVIMAGKREEDSRVRGGNGPRVRRGRKRKINTLVRNSNRSRTIQMTVGVRSRRCHDLFLFAYPASFQIRTRLLTFTAVRFSTMRDKKFGRWTMLFRAKSSFLIFLYLYI